ncbi:MAG: ion channel [Candidatus Marinimicrobia bacterium]|nr:ion channel [Candidatus Neomarinimicrobiota bacterium]
MKIKPLDDRVLVVPADEEETTASGLIIPDTAKEKPRRGTVAAVGNDEELQELISEGDVIISALKASRTKISLFLSFVILMAMIIGSILYIVEGGSNPDMDNIPKSIYWAVVTMTTVGYGDVTPITPLGKMLATLVMIMGYGILAVPTGIVTAEISGRVIKMRDVIFKKCPNCGQNEHHKDADYCHKCSEEL